MEGTTTAALNLNMTKGVKIDMTKSNPGLKIVKFGLGWDANAGNGAQFDLDASAILLNKDNKIYQANPQSVIYFHNLTGFGVTHSGDNLTGEGDGDDEVITVDLSAVPAEVDSVVFLVNIYEAASRGQNFGQVKNAHITAYDGEAGTKLANYDLSEDYSANNAVIFGRMYRKEADWKFEAVGEGRNGSLPEVAATFSA